MAKFKVGDELTIHNAYRASLKEIKDSKYFLVFSDKSDGWHDMADIDKYANLNEEYMKRKQFKEEMDFIVNENS